MLVYRRVYNIPGPSSLGAKWFRYRVSIYHPLIGTATRGCYDNPVHIGGSEDVKNHNISRMIDPKPVILSHNSPKTSFTHRIQVWYIHLHLVDFHGKCR